MIKRLCLFPGCDCFRIDGEGYCSKHLEWGRNKEEERKRKAFEKAHRANEELYKTAEWRNLRRKKLLECPVCEICGSEINLQVHHRKAPRGNPDLFFDIFNLQTVCADCHRKITAHEIFERKK